MRRKKERLLVSEYALCSVVYAALALFAAWLFYDSLYAALIFLPFYFLFVKIVKTVKAKRRTAILTEEFIRSLVSVSSSLSAGISAENAFITAAEDLQKMYGKGSLMVKELAVINSQVSMGWRLERALDDFARRTGIEEIYDFAVVFAVAKEKGADLPTVISSVTRLMADRQRSQSEARVLIRAKQYEQRVMCIIPPGILTYLRFSSGSFIGVLYHNTLGYCVMTGCLVIYVAAIILAERIGDIAV